MTDKKKLGDRGEDYTARYLEKQGFHIVERNWHSRYGEIDIIAENDYLNRIIDRIPYSNPSTKKQMEKIRTYMQKFINSHTGSRLS